MLKEKKTTFKLNQSLIRQVFRIAESVRVLNNQDWVLTIVVSFQGNASSTTIWAHNVASKVNDVI